jgi:hypothetical protein
MNKLIQEAFQKHIAHHENNSNVPISDKTKISSMVAIFLVSSFILYM